MGGPSLILSSFSDLADSFPLTALIHAEELQALLANAEKAAHPAKRLFPELLARMMVLT